jgi:16S rRNA G527 N7-methylase RsmG
MPKSFYTTLSSALTENRLELSNNQKDSLVVLYDACKKWNPVFNITANMTEDLFIAENIIDPLLACGRIDEAVGLSRCPTFLDVGCGGGFVGFAAALFWKDSKLMLLDKSRKRINFCKQAIRLMGLKNCVAIQEYLSSGGVVDQCFDVALSRATFSVDRLVSMFLQPGKEKANRSLACFLGPKTLEELVFQGKLALLEKARDSKANNRASAGSLLLKNGSKIKCSLLPYEIKQTKTDRYVLLVNL